MINLFEILESLNVWYYLPIIILFKRVIVLYWNDGILLYHEIIV